MTAALDESGGQKWTVERVLEAHKEGIDVKKVSKLHLSGIYLAVI